MKTKKKGLRRKWNNFFPRVQVKTKKKKFSPKLEHFFPRILVETCVQMHTQGRSQKLAMGGQCWGSWGGAPSARKVCIFLQNELNFRAILIKNNAFKTWHRNWQRNVIQLVALMGYMGSG